MEDDSPPPQPLSSLQVMVHPLSMVSMADHCTRCIYHGTPIHALSPSHTSSSSSPPPPIVGLLFGTVAVVQQQQQEYPESNHATTNTSTSTIITISDAEDVPIVIPHPSSSTNTTSIASNATTTAASTSAIELHQAVYTNHVVVGWYRVHVVNDYDNTDGTIATPQLQQEEPTADDLFMSQQLVQQYGGHHPQQQQQQQSLSLSTLPFIFALLHVPKPPSSATADTGSSNNNNNNNNTFDEKPQSSSAATSATTTTTTTNTSTLSLSELLAESKRNKTDADTTTTTTTAAAAAAANNTNAIPLSLYYVDTKEEIFIGLDYYSTRNNNNNNNINSSSSSSSISDTWKLVTAPYERIAVERIMEHNQNNNTATTGNGQSKSSGKISLLQQSLYAIYERLDTLDGAVQQLLLRSADDSTTATTTTITDPNVSSLLRHVNGLLLHVRVMSSMMTMIDSTTIATSSVESSLSNKLNAMIPSTNTPILVDTTSTTTSISTKLLLQQLVTLGQTISTIQQYTDKLRVVQQYTIDSTALTPTGILKSSSKSGNAALDMSSESLGNSHTSRQYARSAHPYSMYD